MLKTFAVAALLLVAAAPASAGLYAQFGETFEEDVRIFRDAIEESVIDDDGYFQVVIAMELKGVLGGPPAGFQSVVDKLLEVGETVAHHRLAAALKHRGWIAEAVIVEEHAEGGIFQLTNVSVTNP